MKFSEMPYERPDIAAVQEQYAAILADMDGAETAEQVEITVTAVLFSDGRRWEIPDDQVETWTFTRNYTNNNNE